MTKIKMGISGIVIYLLISGCVLPALALDSFTQADRERLVRMEATQTVFMQQVDKRLEQVDKRFEQIDKRFEQIDKRFEELRTDMNTRFELSRSDMNARFELLRTDMNARFEQVDKRFEQVDKRFEQTIGMFYALSAIFTTLFAAVFSFAWWDRRSVLITARKTAEEVVDENARGIQETTLIVNRLVEVLRSYADKDPAFRDIMQLAHLL